METPRWNIITPSQYEWERRGLDFIRAGLPNHDPYRAWANFEFQTPDGAIYEVDLLVLTKQGFWLVEIKSWPGRVRGDAGTWTRTHEGRTVSEDNPVMLANRKAKALVSLLKTQPAARNINVPWMEAVVFLSADDLQCDLAGPARNRVLLKDRPAEESRPERKGILAALLNREGPGIDLDSRSVIDSKVAKAISRSVEQSGIRPSQRSRRVGDYVLGELLADGPGYQDRLAKHASFDDVHCRVRQYTVAQASSEDDRQRLKRAAAREFQIIQSLNHPHILPVLDYKEHELGPALLFRYLDPHAIRFDHYLATQCHKLTTDVRLKLLRQIADAKASGDQDFLSVGAIYRGREDFGVAALVAELVESESVPFLPSLRYKPSGLRKRQVWEQTWKLQRHWETGEGTSETKVPPKYTGSDFLKSGYYRLRGKLDVPKERWISFPQCETESDPSLVVGWAGWNHLQQATAIIAYYDARKREGWDAKRLTPLLAGLDQLLPWIHQWHPDVDPEFGETAGQSFETMLKADAHELGLTLEDIRAWEPPAKKKPARQPRKARKTRKKKSDVEGKE